MTADAIRWCCGRCEVSVGQIDGTPGPLPSAWSRDNGQVLCLACSRAQAGEAAVVSAPDSTSREERLRLRRTALIEYEIDRAPEAPNRTIALACHTSSATVAAVRGDLDASGAAPADIDARSVA